MEFFFDFFFEVKVLLGDFGWCMDVESFDDVLIFWCGIYCGYILFLVLFVMIE